MKRYIACSRDENKYDLSPGDSVTVYASTGYANYEGILEDIYTNKYNVQIARVSTKHGYENVPLSSVIPSQRDYFYSLSLDDILTEEFLSEMGFKDDAMWCDRVRVPRVDADPSIENTVGYDVYVAPNGSRYRVIITEYVSKHRSTTSYRDESKLALGNPKLDDAIDMMKSASEVVVNFAGYQRIFNR